MECAKAVSVVSSGTRRNLHSYKASHFQFCHHPHTALWPRMCCVVAATYPSLAKLHHALFAYNPGYLWDIKHNTTIRKLGHQQQLYSLLLARHLCFVGHISRMPDSWLPKQLLVCAPAQGAGSAGGQKCCWNDLVHRDLVKCEMEQYWRELGQDRLAWRGVVEMCIDTINKETERMEDRKKDDRKRTQQSISLQLWLGLSVTIQTGTSNLATGQDL